MTEWMIGGTGVIVGLVAGLELSRVLWQREVEALTTQLRRATEDLNRKQRPVPLRVVVQETTDDGSGDAA